MAAQRAGVTVARYIRTRTPRDLALDVRAWIATWAYPLKVALGKPKRDRRPVHDSTSTTGGATPSWFRPKQGVKYNYFDLGPIEGEPTSGRGESKDWNHATAALKQAWGGYSAGWRGTSRGIASGPVAEKLGMKIPG